VPAGRRLPEPRRKLRIQDERPIALLTGLGLGTTVFAAIAIQLRPLRRAVQQAHGTEGAIARTRWHRQTVWSALICVGSGLAGGLALGAANGPRWLLMLGMGVFFIALRAADAATRRR
jgi:hypothetical protein